MPAIGRAQFGQVVVDLRAIPREVRKDLRPALQRAGGAVMADAKGRASWSSRIPGAMRISVLYGRSQGVMIRVSRRRAPHARAYEGIGARRGNASTFRHPLYGDRNRWYTQATRPYLQPAARRAEVRKAVTDVVEAAARRHGFR